VSGDMNSPSSPLFYALMIMAKSIILSVILTRIVMFIARRSGFIHSNNPIVGDSRSVALGGGVAFGAVIIGFMITLNSVEYIPARLIISLCLAITLGLIDDFNKLEPKAKILGELIIIIFYLAQLKLEPWALPVAGVFLLISQNAWNMVDVMDGLAGWIAVIFFLGMAGILFLTSGRYFGLAFCAVVVAGAVLGFLVWNSNPARVFMGESGSLLLGTLCSIMIIEVAIADFRLSVMLVLAGLIPFFETGFLVVERVLRHIPVYLGSPDHFALRLLNRGYSVSKIIGIVVMIGIVLSLISIVIVWSQFKTMILAAAFLILVMGMLFTFRYLHSLPVGERSNVPK
jgi:UDP-GlcNAc:undecaprenyl-phosphate/decaprenyl-phosphate GlcNAc-1-phosphate transferase